jgi:hypothetical protein
MDIFKIFKTPCTSANFVQNGVAIAAARKNNMRNNPAHPGAFKRLSTKNKKRVELRATGLELTNASSNKFLICKFLATLNKLEKELDLLLSKSVAEN